MMKLMKMAMSVCGTVEMDIVNSHLYKIDNPKSPFHDPDGSKMYNANKEKFDALIKKSLRIRLSLPSISTRNRSTLAQNVC